MNILYYRYLCMTSLKSQNGSSGTDWQPVFALAELLCFVKCVNSFEYFINSPEVYVYRLELDRDTTRLGRVIVCDQVFAVFCLLSRCKQLIHLWRREILRMIHVRWHTLRCFGFVDNLMTHHIG